MVGNLADVRADILEHTGPYERVRDTIIVRVEGGARMTNDELEAKVEEVYNG